MHGQTYTKRKYFHKKGDDKLLYTMFYMVSLQL